MMTDFKPVQGVLVSVRQKAIEKGTVSYYWRIARMNLGFSDGIVARLWNKGRGRSDSISRKGKGGS